jgi:hypothetical protein
MSTAKTFGCSPATVRLRNPMNFDNVTSKNSLLYALTSYDNPQCLNTEEFEEDYRGFKYIKRLARRYLTTKRLNVQLMLNHIILLNNVFGPVATSRLLFVKCDDARMYTVLKPFLTYLNILPDVVEGIDGADIYTASIPLDAKLLRQIQEV